MYSWLSDALNNSSHVLTASRRLARVLQLEFSQQQLAAGITVWRTPAIHSMHDWLVKVIATAENRQQLPARINPFQSRLLWERCLRREINDPLLNIGVLARQCDDTWARLQEWKLPLAECEAAAFGKDKRVFARAARHYRSILETENWIDQAGLPSLATGLIRDRQAVVPPGLAVAGFDRITPQVGALLEALEGAGCALQIIDGPRHGGEIVMHSYENSDAELRAAGAWARGELERAPGQRIAVVVSNLEQDAAKAAHLLKEGLLPGWQNLHADFGSIVNVSYGRKLATYPAIEIALLALRWLHSDLSSAEISALLRTTVVGLVATDSRSRTELWLRNLPDQNWTPEMFLAAVTADGTSADTADWLQRMVGLTEFRDRSPKRDSPAAWAGTFDEVLTQLNWPGSEELGSLEFQLINRWRQLLNELAELELVTPSMSMAEAHGRLAALAKETVFQPEGKGAAVDLLGSLEAAGMEFDKLWIAGLTANNWPPPGKPLSLVSRDLQRQCGMPDAEPQDTLEYAERVIARLVQSTPACVISYPLTEGDAEQTATTLIQKYAVAQGAEVADPYWGAARLLGRTALRVETNDPVPAVARNELVAGGATTIQRQSVEPFAAFAHGRLGVRPLQGFSQGLAANVRGNLIHEALHRLYGELPDSDEISNWSESDIDKRIEVSVRAAFARQERLADSRVRCLLGFEKNRVRVLLRGVIEQDKQREPFSIRNVERDIEATIGGLRVRLRFDRIDQVGNDEIIILDYKTGMPKRLLTRSKEPRDLQLVAYTCAVDAPVAGIGLVNIDSRAISLDAAGRTFTPELDWDRVLTTWQARVEVIAAELAKGDVRLNPALNTQSGRPLALLSRRQELGRDN